MKFIQSFIYYICLFVAFMPLWSCNNEPSCKKSIASFITENDSNLSVKEVIVSDKYISKADSTAIKKYISKDTSTEVEDIMQKMSLTVGSDIYFSVLNSNDINDEHIENIINNDRRYTNLKLPPQTYCIFSIISVVDKYGDGSNMSMAFLIDKENHIKEAKFVEPSFRFLQLFDKNEIEQFDFFNE